jgi:preprotein translocase subunit SecA
MLLRQAWLEKNKRQDDERAIPELAPLYRPLDDLQAADLRQMARSLDLPLNPEDPENLGRLVRLVDLKPGDEGRLVSVLQGGVAHQVLNARKHDEESQIIARAGAFGSVTIATNMAGRGVDIKLGGDLPEEVLGDANRALVKAGHDNAYDMTHSERRRALLSVDLSEVGLYEEGARAFLEYLDNMERVRELGGLHVIGSERHEARRIDNQLRGRAARQGDPGSSRFYLALDDDLMRLFGGQQVEGLLARLNIDEAVPIESGLVGRLVEQSQTRVEGANFDVRKHLLEYDDVLNSQRARIYSQRDQVFTKEDLREDVSEMLQAELQKRIPEALKDEEGPWKLLAYLEEIQPALEYEDVIFPSYTQRLMLFELTRYIDEASTGAAGADKRTKDGRAPEGRTPDKRTPDGQGVILQALLALAEQALDMEHEHLMKAAQELLDRSEETLQAQIDERLDALAALVEGWKDISPEEAEGPRRPQDLAEEIAASVRMPVRLTPEQNRQLLNDPEPVAEAVGKQVSMQLMALMANRLVGSFERRLEESLNLRTIQIQEADWNEVRETLRQALEETITRRRERLLGSRSQDSRTQEAQGQIARDLSQLLPREAADGQAGLSDELFIRLLGAMARGTRVAFDRKTHRQNFQYTTRLRYSFLAARLLQDQPPQSVTADVLEHLEQAEVMIGRMWGRSEWNRLLQAEATLGQLTGKVKDEIQVALDAQHGAGHFESVAVASLQSYSTDDRDGVVEILGRRVLSELYRQLLLGVVSELWVDYLTRVEALRVSIGLEAYAQRDPLVQYKSQATEMFSNLIASVRSGVISRMFTYRPRQVAAASAVAAPPVERSVEEASEAGAGTPARSAAPASTAAAPGGQEGGSGGRHKKKRKRH